MEGRRWLVLATLVCVACWIIAILIAKHLIGE